MNIRWMSRDYRGPDNGTGSCWARLGEWEEIVLEIDDFKYRGGYLYKEGTPRYRLWVAPADHGGESKMFDSLEEAKAAAPSMVKRVINDRCRTLKMEIERLKKIAEL